MSARGEDAAGVVARHLGLDARLLASTVLAETGAERAVVRFDGAAGPVAVAKIYADETGASTFEAQRDLAAQASRTVHLAIPRPLLYDRASRTLVQEYAIGTELRAAVPVGRAGVMERAGRAVAELHALDPLDCRDRSADDHMSDLMRPHPRLLARRRPELGPRIGALLAALRAALPSAGAHRAVIHRDLHPGQMLAGDDRIWILDWDLVSAGDPAMDVGNLSVWLETHLDRDLAARCRERFLAGYVDVAGAGVLAREDAYRGVAYLRLACKRLRLGEDPATRIRPMIERAELALTVSR